MSYTWHGDAFTAALRGRLAGNLTAAAAHLADVMRESVATAGPPASDPGSPPHRRTGDLQASITSTEADPETLTARAGSATAVAAYLEHGTNRMAARPFARPALAENADDVAELALDGIGRRA